MRSPRSYAPWTDACLRHSPYRYRHAAAVALVTTPATVTFNVDAQTLNGHCARCGCVHHQPNNTADALAPLQALFDSFTHDDTPVSRAVRRTAGKMCGVLVGEQAAARGGGRVVLRAFSGDLEGVPDWPGFVTSVLRRNDTDVLEQHTLRAIAAFDAQLQLAAHTHDARRIQLLRHQRRLASAALMSAMHDAARLCSASGVVWPLRRAFVGAGIPSGTADCAVPKLLDAANRAGITVHSVLEAWYGPVRGERRHGVVQQPCARKCQPILGFLLCPVADDHAVVDAASIKTARP